MECSAIGACDPLDNEALPPRRRTSQPNGPDERRLDKQRDPAVRLALSASAQNSRDNRRPARAACARSRHKGGAECRGMLEPRARGG
jgi:hypothetical protein